jgi:hypothetical protein
MGHHKSSRVVQGRISIKITTLEVQVLWQQVQLVVKGRPTTDHKELKVTVYLLAKEDTEAPNKISEGECQSLKQLMKQWHKQ